MTSLHLIIEQTAFVNLNTAIQHALLLEPGYASENGVAISRLSNLPGQRLIATHSRCAGTNGQTLIVMFTSAVTPHLATLIAAMLSIRHPEKNMTLTLDDIPVPLMSIEQALLLDRNLPAGHRESLA